MGDELKQTADALQSAEAEVLEIVTDITQVSEVSEMAEAVHRRWGAVDVLVNCAGTFSVIAPFWEADPEQWFRDVRVNLYGNFLVYRAFVKGMVEQKHGYVINIVSSGGVGDPHAYSTSYASSKTGLMRLTEGLAQELKAYGVKVFAVAPPAILTEMTRFIMNNPGGKRWRPDFSKAFKEGRDTPPESVALLCYVSVMITYP